ncbi:1-phosphofructokinase [Priestia flexa]|uniref:1-phosphofructokinase n=1 Tax=Priestia flexa TaxID=86664 RepID=UPI002E2160A5|nr:1-phosphofructokinase [Priestia flexa]MED3825654.1 1-phosphofructokinase [Priestia flexa]
MIYTCTLNPSVDYIVHVTDFKEGELNRTTSEVKFPGGKGINVSRVLKRLGVENKALGFIGGFTGTYIEDYLKTEEIKTAFTRVNEDTRINVKLKTKAETEVNGQGPTISEEALQQLLQQISQMKEHDVLVLAGSIPKTLPKDIYETITQQATAKGVKVVVDASGKTLLDVVKHNPFFIKPNHHELGELFNVEVSGVEDAIQYGQKLVEMGAKNVGVSMAGDGALLITKDAVYRATAPKGNVKNSVGAGDSLVAGFLAAYTKENDLLEAFRTGVASGSATAFSLELCEKSCVEELLEQVSITKIK